MKKSKEIWLDKHYIRLLSQIYLTCGIEILCNDVMIQLCSCTAMFQNFNSKTEQNRSFDWADSAVLQHLAQCEAHYLPSQPHSLSTRQKLSGALDVHNPWLWSWDEPSVECHNSGYMGFWKMVGCIEGQKRGDRDEDWTYLTSRNRLVVRSRTYPMMGISLGTSDEALSAWMSVRMLLSISPGDHAQPNKLLAFSQFFWYPPKYIPVCWTTTIMPILYDWLIW